MTSKENSLIPEDPTRRLRRAVRLAHGLSIAVLTGFAIAAVVWRGHPIPSALAWTNLGFAWMACATWILQGEV